MNGKRHLELPGGAGALRHPGALTRSSWPSQQQPSFGLEEELFNQEDCIPYRPAGPMRKLWALETQGGFEAPRERKLQTPLFALFCRLIRGVNTQPDMHVYIHGYDIVSWVVEPIYAPIEMK